MAIEAGLETLLRVGGLTKRFGRREALRDVSFTIFPGEFVGLLGPNGAGKTTLAAVIAGLLAPDAGSVQLFGRSLSQNRGVVLAQLGVVFQSRSLDLEMSVAANLRFHAALFGMSGSAARQRIEELAALLEFEPLLRRAVRTLSGGNQRRVEIARALINRPRLTLMDEASTGLDPAARPALLAHLHQLCHRDGTSVLWATHLLDEVTNADRLIVLSNGTVRDIGPPPDVMQRAKAATLVDAYVTLSGGA